MTSGNDRQFSKLPAGAPARRVRVDFGPSPIRGSAPPLRIIDSEPKLARRSVVDVD